FTGSVRQRRWAGLPLAAATLTKLLPALLLVYLFVRSWRASLVGVAGIGALLAIGQIMYGSLMGLGYPLAVLSGGGDSIARWSIEFSLAIVTMLLVSPHTAQDYLVTALPVLAVWLYLWSERLPRPWSVRQTALGALAALFIGVFVPMNLFARVLPLGW